MPAENPATPYIDEAEEFVYCVYGVQIHSGPSIFLVSLHKDLARMNDVPVSNDK